MQDPKLKISEILKSARERARLGIRELGRATNVSPSDISKLEKGIVKLGPVTLQKLTSVLPLTPEERGLLAEWSGLTSSRMQTAPQILSAATDWDQFCLAMIRLTRHQTGVSEENFFQGFGVKSGIWTKGYDLLIRLRDQTWLGFAIKPEEIRVARTGVDDHKALPKTEGKAFESAGGIILLLTQRRISP